jgi:DNA-binding SARP family transcriptional activator
LATSAGDHGALAAAHTALAMVAAAQGDRRSNDAHYLEALEHAQLGADTLQTIRIRTNRSSFFLDEGAFANALAEAEAAITLADLSSHSTFHSLALVNRAEALLHLGRLDEAHVDLDTARDIEQRLRSLDVRYPLLRLGDLYRIRGDRSLARNAYGEALRLSEQTGDVQSLIPALSGLARALADDDPVRALERAERAVAESDAMGRCGALLALARVRMSSGDMEAASALARTVQEEAVERRDRPAMAESLEIAALGERDRDAALALLDESRGIWEQLGSPIGALRALLAAGRIMGGSEGDLLASHAVAELHTHGAHGTIVTVPAAGAAGRPLEIQCLGGFRVVRDGAIVPVTEWQSRKARDLLKVLVARRGRATSRESLMAVLWPDEAPERLGNRLAVALSTVRGVLDPERRHPGDHYVRAERDAVGLDLDHLIVDLEQVIAAVERGLDLVRQGRREEGVALLEIAERRYRGDFLEEDLYEDWAISPREQARALYVSALRILADAATQQGDHDGAVRRQLRLLERDPYDEPAHLALVRTLSGAGRHGEARRHYGTYTRRMDELGVESDPFPG